MLIRRPTFFADGPCASSFFCECLVNTLPQEFLAVVRPLYPVEEAGILPSAANAEAMTNDSK